MLTNVHPTTLTYEVTACGGSNQLKSLEHVEVMVNVKYSRRGALRITLVSPAGKLIRTDKFFEGKITNRISSYRHKI